MPVVFGDASAAIQPAGDAGAVIRSRRTGDGATGGSAAIRELSASDRQVVLLESTWTKLKSLRSRSENILKSGARPQRCIRQGSYGLPLETSDIMWVLWHERGRDRLWGCNDDEKYSLNPDT